MIYFIRPKAGGLIKIGTSVQLSTRLVALANECGAELEVVAVTAGGLTEEHALHRQFAHLRKHGEWFEAGDDLLGFIVQHASPWDGTDEVNCERVRLYFDAAEELRLALKQEALKAGVSVSSLIEQVLRDKFPKAVEEAKKVLRDRPKS